MQNHFTVLDWIVLGVYFAATMSIGFYFWRRSRSTEGFTAAGRSLPGWVCGLSIFATYLSSISYLALPGKSFVDNWNPFVFSLSIPIANWIAVRWFLPYYRASGEVSAYALLERRFGVWARLYASVFYLLTQIARMGVVMYLMALPLAVIFGWDIRVIILFTGLSVTVYSFVGGIIAVIWADAIQALVLMAGAVICLAVMLFSVEGGPAHVLTTAAAAGKFSLGELGAGSQQGRLWFDAGSATFLVVLLYGLFLNLQNFGIDQSYIQRYIASSSDREARKSLWLGGILYVPVSAVFFLIGTTLFVYYQSEQHERELPEIKQLVAQQRLMQRGVHPEYENAEAEAGILTEAYRRALDAEAAELTDRDIGDRVFPHFIAKHLPAGLTGLLIAAIFAAAMSTVSTSLNSSATLLMSDYYHRFFNPGATDKQRMVALYLGTVVWGILGTGMALMLVKLTESALDIWWTLSGIFGGGMCGLFLLGMISRAKNPAAVAGVIVGVLVILWMSFPKLIDYLLAQPLGSAVQELGVQLQQHSAGWRSPFHAFMVPVIGALAILCIGLLVSRLSGGGDHPAARNAGDENGPKSESLRDPVPRSCR